MDIVLKKPNLKPSLISYFSYPNPNPKFQNAGVSVKSAIGNGPGYFFFFWVCLFLLSSSFFAYTRIFHLAATASSPSSSSSFSFFKFFAIWQHVYNYWADIDIVVPISCLQAQNLIHIHIRQYLKPWIIQIKGKLHSSFDSLMLAKFPSTFSTISNSQKNSKQYLW